jgi:DNA polymerase/3'-5' exonuclease PolX
MSKSKFPREKALEVARDLYTQLIPSCFRLKVAGSLRRRLSHVSDIEFVVIPKTDLLDVDLFGDEKFQRDQLSLVLESMIGWGTITKRRSAAGREAWGHQNKLAVHTASGIPVDFFITTEENWPMTLFIRTGPKELNIKVASLAKKQGWNLQAYGSGFHNTKTFPPLRHIVKSEEDIFAFVGLPYVPPERRR